MLKALSPGAVNVSTPTLEDRVRAARDFGFQAVEVDINEIVRRGPEECLTILGDIKPAGWGLPVEWRGEEDAWRASLEQLPAQAKAAAALGCNRTATWILPGSNDRDLADNRRFHIERFKPVADILGEHGCSLGLEFIGPKTLRDQFKYEFVWRMQDMLEMGREIGPNVGLLLDCWHWYTSHGTVDELKQLTAKDVVYVHVNDAPAGVDIDQQVDNVRCLPAETGVIPVGSFLRVLKEIGYDGPLVPEPFKKELSDLPTDDDRLKLVSASMDKMLAQI
jgi:sugar phosphate isomerase/epimerase